MSTVIASKPFFCCTVAVQVSKRVYFSLYVHCPTSYQAAPPRNVFIAFYRRKTRMEVTPDDELVGKRKARFLDAFWRQLHTFAVPVLNTFGSVGKTKDDEPAGLLTKTD